MASDYVFKVLDRDGSELLSVGIELPASGDAPITTVLGAQADLPALFRRAGSEAWSVAILSPAGRLLGSVPFADLAAHLPSALEAGLWPGPEPGPTRH